MEALKASPQKQAARATTSSAHLNSSQDPAAPGTDTTLLARPFLESAGEEQVEPKLTLKLKLMEHPLQLLLNLFLMLACFYQAIFADDIMLTAPFTALSIYCSLYFLKTLSEKPHKIKQ